MTTLPSPDEQEQFYKGALWDRFTDERMKQMKWTGDIPMFEEWLEGRDIQSVLEVGCGCGQRMRALIAGARKTIRVVGIDCNEKALAISSQYAETVCCSAFHLPFGDKSFDLVYTSGTLMAFPGDSVVDVMSEIYRVAKRWIGLNEAHTDSVAPDGGHTLYEKEQAWWHRNFTTLYMRSFSDLVLIESGVPWQRKPFRYALFEKQGVSI